MKKISMKRDEKITIGEGLEKYLRWCRLNNYSDDTIKKVVSLINKTYGYDWKEYRNLIRIKINKELLLNEKNKLENSDIDISEFKSEIRNYLASVKVLSSNGDFVTIACKGIVKRVWDMEHPLLRKLPDRQCNICIESSVFC